MQNGGMTLAAQMEERKSRSLSDSWAKLLDTGTGLPDHGVSVINHATLWDHIRTPLYGMESGSTSTAEIKDCWMNSPAGNDVSWPSNEVKIVPSSQHSRQIAEQNRWIASSSPFCSSSNNNNNNNKTDDNKSNNNNAAGNREAFCYSDGNAGKFLFRPDAFPCGPFTKLLDPTNTLPPDSLDLELEGFPASSKVSIPLVQLPGPLKAPATFPSSNILTFHSNMNKLDIPYTSPSPKPVLVQQQKSGGSPSSSPSTSSSNNNLQKNAVDEGGECTTEQKRSSDQAGLSNAAFKKPRTEPSAGPPMKVRKEKLGERITALQQLVSPFGKTDTASVLFEAMGYIKFLQDQVQVLSSPYLKGVPPSQKDGRGDQAKYDLRSRGLCLVPVSCTLHVANNNGADFWTSGIGSGSKF